MLPLPRLPMKILFVAMSDTIHTARWIGQLAGLGWDVHLFPSIDTGETHADIAGVTVHHSVFSHKGNPGANRYRGLRVSSRSVARFARSMLTRLLPGYRTWQLRRLAAQLRPDLIHSLEIQHAGYLVRAIKDDWQGRFPRWWVTNWGSDIYLFGRLEEHRQRIRAVLEACDHYSCECARDVALGREFGFRGAAMPVMPNAGGFDLARVEVLRGATPPSRRRTIMLKGYQHWAGRALVGLRALARCADVLPGYTVVVYSANADVVLAARLFAQETGIAVRFIEAGAPHEQILRGHAAARISIGLSISDAISMSLLEAMVMGSFPIQSCTACADEWLEHGVGGLLVPPEDPDVIAAALRQALTDDGLVDGGAEQNWRVACARLAADDLRARAVAMYAGLNLAPLPKEGANG